MNELAKPLTSLDKALKAETSAFLPSIRIINANSSEVEDGTAQKGDLFCQDTNLTKTTTVIVINYRWNASLVENGKRTKQSFDVDSPISQALKNDDANRKGSYPEYVIRRGIEFLVFVPAMDAYALFHPNTWSARQTGVSAKIVNTVKPLTERSEAAKKMPHTRFFTLASKTMDNKFKTPIPHITPIDEDPSQASTPEALELALKMFTDPVVNESKMTEDTDDNER